MKNVLLLGDSIRFGAPPNSPGYGIYVKEILKDYANVYAPDDNCRFAMYTLRYLFDWSNKLKDTKIDVVHWNNGLWELLRLNGDDPLASCDVYVMYLERVYKMLRKLFPEAKIIFALTTTVIEEWTDSKMYILNSDIDKYNRAAAKLMDSLEVEVNDLYSLSNTLGSSMHSDFVHFNEEGSKILAEAVVKKIMSV